MKQSYNTPLIILRKIICYTCITYKYNISKSACSQPSNSSKCISHCQSKATVQQLLFASFFKKQKIADSNIYYRFFVFASRSAQGPWTPLDPEYNHDGRLTIQLESQLATAIPMGMVTPAIVTSVRFSGAIASWAVSFVWQKDGIVCNCWNILKCHLKNSE